LPLQRLARTQTACHMPSRRPTPRRRSPSPDEPGRHQTVTPPCLPPGCLSRALGGLWGTQLVQHPEAAVVPERA
jgi:hypothetical protein